MRLIVLFFSLFFSSCVYFNTFYNTEDSFEEAIEIIENDSSGSYKENSEIPNTAKKLLYESISSADIIINEHPESKYVDDAIYYIARSYFSLNEFYKSEKYFNKLINEFPGSLYYNEGKLWLEYTHLKMGLLDIVEVNILNIENDFKLREKEINKEIFFLLYSLKGDFFVELKEYDRAFIEFDKSLSFIKSKSKKTVIYSKLAYICESDDRLDQAIDYLKKIEITSNNKEIKLESFRNRLAIMDNLGFYNDIISEIEEKVNSSEFESEKLKDEFNLKLSTSYMKINKFNEAKEMFNQIISNTNQKKIKCEAYYWLGYISLINEFDLELAIEYFNFVTETMRSSDFSKKVKIYIEDIESYNDLLEEYEFLIKDDNSQIKKEDNDKDNYLIPMPVDILDNQDYSDSLLFIIAEKLYFDFNQTELSIKKYEELIQSYPNSVYTKRSKKNINQLEGNNFSYKNEIDSLKILRDLAWDKFTFDKMEGVNIFHKLINQYDDFYSHYSLAVIYENYLHLTDSSIYYYVNSLNKCDDQNLKKNLKNKLLLLEESINDSINLFNQKLDYLKGASFIIDDFQLDSAQLYFNSNELNTIINNYKNLSNDLDLSLLRDSLLNPDWKHKKYEKTSLDSILFELANISLWFFKDKELSEEYSNVILSNKESEYYNLSEYMINYGLNSPVVDSLEQYFESYKDKANQYIDRYYYDDSLEKRCKDNLIIYNNLLNYFPEKEKEEFVDSLLNRENIGNQKIAPNINSKILPNLKEKDLND